jgi:uncharacterized phiE125 gp8 family phage protein
MSLQVNIKTDVATELITLDQAKAWLRVDGSDEDTLITELIISARSIAENYCNSTFAEKTYTMWIDDIAERDNRFFLAYPPHKSITSVKQLDEEETKTTLTLNSGYYKRGIKEFEIIINSVVPATGVIGVNVQQAIEVEYVAGFTTVPKDIITAMKRIIITNWEFREDWIQGGIALVPQDARKLLNPYKYDAI